MKVSLIMLVLAALLVAMLVPAFAVTADNGADALMLGTKIIMQEEVGGALAAENIAAFAVDPNKLQTSAIYMMSSTVSERYAVHDITLGSIYSSHMTAAEPTPGAGGDGFARFT